MYMQPAGAAMQSAVNTASNAARSFSGVEYIGQDPLGGRFFKGSLDDFRIINRSLSAAEIRQFTFPTVVTAANASTVTNTSAVLSVLGADATGGESSLTYTWSTTGTPPAPVIFTPTAPMPPRPLQPPYPGRHIQFPGDGDQRGGIIDHKQRFCDSRHHAAHGGHQSGGLPSRSGQYFAH